MCTPRSASCDVMLCVERSWGEETSARSSGGDFIEPNNLSRPFHFSFASLFMSAFIPREICFASSRSSLFQGLSPKLYMKFKGEPQPSLSSLYVNRVGSDLSQRAFAASIFSAMMGLID